MKLKDEDGVKDDLKDSEKEDQEYRDNSPLIQVTQKLLSSSIFWSELILSWEGKYTLESTVSRLLLDSENLRKIGIIQMKRR